MISDSLRQHWPRIDAFEGSDYRRSLVTVYDNAGFLVVANLYELRDPTP